MSHRPSVWCFKYFFLNNFLQHSLQKSFQFFFSLFLKLYKNKNKEFWATQIKMIFGLSDPWSMRQSTQRIILKIVGFHVIVDHKNGKKPKITLITLVTHNDIFCLGQSFKLLNDFVDSLIISKRSCRKVTKFRQKN